MEQKTKKLFMDCLCYGRDILSIVRGVTLKEYLADRTRCYAVRHAFTVIGEAMNAIRISDEEALKAFPEAAQIIGLRNRLVHGYMEIDDTIIWDLTHGALKEFLNKLKKVLS
jgi:uncharacterized protein with HEPN domain